MNPVKSVKMSVQIPTEVAEVRLTYRNKVYAADRPQIRSSHHAYQVFWDNWEEDTIGLFETAYLLLLDRANRVMGWFKVSQGGMAGTVVDAKVIFATALKARASSIILAHNHPSGQLRPSKADSELTQKLFTAGKALDLPLLDHLILAPEGGFYSFADEGLINH
ncbi:JAB domain-containing protein [Phaeodactylibacter sp.]|uniref:JAB domain-containing protein n=1 Tax=Phaeodactylibacter sp. TaxID=1940289 RepID=UPI0025F6435B|nr:JAB domain-containing protein [Phaeodactylibacter sp.]MCI5092685.1 JAB domain-containing protein [Phaeodactylibacter sp.]